MYYCRRCNNFQEFERPYQEYSTERHRHWGVAYLDAEGELVDTDETDNEYIETEDNDGYEYTDEVTCSRCNHEAEDIDEAEWIRLGGVRDNSNYPSALNQDFEVRKQNLQKLKEIVMREVDKDA